MKHDKRINVWGCFCAHRVGNLYLVEGNLEQLQYNQILREQLLPSAQMLFPDGNYIFQQDNDPKHTANLNKNWVRDNLTATFEWPSQSPDLNPIENLWSYLDKCCTDRKPKNSQELFTILKEAWDKIPIDILERHVDSMPRRCQAVIDAKGWPTKY